MNEFLRLLDRFVVRPQGYRLRRWEQVTLQPLQKLMSHDEAEALRAVETMFDGEVPAPAPGRLHVYLRACLRQSRNTRPHDIVPDRPLEQVILGCVASLVRAVNHAAVHSGVADIRVTAADDHSDPASLARLEQVLSGLTVPWSLETPDATGSGPTMLRQFTATAGEDGLVYYVEDDYLHEETAVTEMVRFYAGLRKATGGEVILHPQEQACLFSRPYPAFILCGEHRRWRTTSHMSHTLMLHGTVVRDHWECFENTKYMGTRKRRLGSERRTTNRLFRTIPGFCPMPALAAHFQSPDTVPPFFDWRPLWSANDPGALTGAGQPLAAEG